MEPGDLPIPDSARTIIVFGGTFDPPTRAHIDLPLAALEATAADWLLYVPAGRSPFKDSGPEAGNADRIEMLRLGLRGADRASISTHEIARPAADEPSYTLATLEHFHEQLGAGRRLRLLIGADQAASFHRWREPARVIELAEPLVMLRPPVETADALLGSMAPHWPTSELAAWRSRIVKVPMLDLSATRVRELLDAPAQNREELGALLPPGVLDYIVEHGLYSK